MNQREVRTLGTGERTVICLPGWFGSSTGWGGWPELLDSSRYTWVFPDYRGYGERRDEPGDHTMDEVAADVLALMDSNGWERVDLVGHSMGGMAVQRVLARAPERVRTLTGISPVPASGVPFDEDSWTLFHGAAQDDANRAAIIDFTTGNRLTRIWIDQMVRHSVERSDRSAFGDYLEAWAKTDFAAQISDKDLPVLVLVGENDPALGAEAMQGSVLQHYPNAELHTVANAGHYSMYETPVALATAVETFLSAH